MRTSTKVWLVILIVSNLLLLYFFRPMINSIRYENSGTYFVFNTEAYIGIALFVIANVSGLIVGMRFISAQPLGRQIFFSIVPATVTFFLLVLFFYSITAMEQTAIVMAVRSGLSIVSPESRFIWVAVVAAIYVFYVSVICLIIAKPLYRVEKAVEILKDGKTKKPIKVGGGKHFKNIESDLNQINEKYKESDKIIKSIDSYIVEESLEKTLPQKLKKSNALIKEVR